MAYGGGQDGTTIEIDPGMGPTIPIVLAVLLLSAIGYVVARSLAAQRRGENAGQAAAHASEPWDRRSSSPS